MRIEFRFHYKFNAMAFIVHSKFTSILFTWINFLPPHTQPPRISVVLPTIYIHIASILHSHVMTVEETLLLNDYHYECYARKFSFSMIKYRIGLVSCSCCCRKIIKNWIVSLNGTNNVIVRFGSAASHSEQFCVYVAIDAELLLWTMFYCFVS